MYTDTMTFRNKEYTMFIHYFIVTEYIKCNEYFIYTFGAQVTYWQTFLCCDRWKKALYRRVAYQYLQYNFVSHVSCFYSELCISYSGKIDKICSCNFLTIVQSPFVNASWRLRYNFYIWWFFSGIDFVFKSGITICLIYIAQKYNLRVQQYTTVQQYNTIPVKRINRKENIIKSCSKQTLKH